MFSTIVGAHYIENNNQGRLSISMSTNFESSGYQVIDNYLSLEECQHLLALISAYRENNEPVEIHRPMKERSLRYNVIDGDKIKADFPEVWQLYQEKVFNQINEINTKHFIPLENTRVGVNINIMSARRSEYRWHYDRARVTAILYLNEVSGGETVLYPNYRILLRRKYLKGLQRFLDWCLRIKIIRAVLRKKTVVSPIPGRMVVMRGNRCWHSVRPVHGDTDRINIILVYDLPGADFPMEKGLDSYLYTQKKQTSSDPNYG